MARLLRFVAVAALVGGATAVLSACSDGTDSVVSESPSASVVVTASPTVSPTPTALTDEELLELIPANARGEDFTSASNFAKFFWSRYPRLFDEGTDDGVSAALWSSISDTGCEFCTSALSSAAEAEEAGQYRVGNEFAWSSDLGAGGLADDGFTYVNLDGAIGGVRTFDAAGDLIDEEDGFDGTFGVQLRYTQGRWVVFGAEFQIHG